MTKELISDDEFGRELEDAITGDMQPTTVKPPLIRPAAMTNQFGDPVPPAPPRREVPTSKPAYDKAATSSLYRPASLTDYNKKPAVLSSHAVDGYHYLESIFGLAYEQAAKGKGHERHAHSPVGFRVWHEQPILANARQVGPAGPAQQVMKKAQESVMMASRKDFEGAKAEALGAMVYAAAMYQLYVEMEQVE